MAGAGFKVWSTGDLVNASEFNTYIMEQTVMVFADSSARDSAISSPSEGMFAFLKDTNTLTFYDGSSWGSFIGEGDITGVTITTAGTSGLSGGATATSGAFTSTLSIAPNSATSATVAGSDIVLIGDADDSNALKKTTAQDIANLASAGVSLGLVLALS
jgi:dTDP-D-glucose 4,6-dehydratase